MNSLKQDLLNMRTSDWCDFCSDRIDHVVRSVTPDTITFECNECGERHTETLPKAIRKELDKAKQRKYRVVALEQTKISQLNGIPMGNEIIHWSRNFWSTSPESARRKANRIAEKKGLTIWQSLYSRWSRKNKTMHSKYKFHNDSRFEIRLLELPQ